MVKADLVHWAMEAGNCNLPPRRRLWTRCSNPSLPRWRAATVWCSAVRGLPHQPPQDGKVLS